MRNVSKSGGCVEWDTVDGEDIVLKLELINTHKIPISESETVEFKTSFNIETVETLVAFANAKGGKVYIGVNDNGKPVKIQLGKESVQQWTNEIKSKTEPSIIPDVETVEIEGNNIVIFSITEFPVKPVAI